MAQHHLHHEASLLIKMLNSYLYFVFKLIINSERIGIDYSLKKKKNNNIFMLQSKINEKNELLLKLFSI